MWSSWTSHIRPGKPSRVQLQWSLKQPSWGKSLMDVGKVWWWHGKRLPNSFKSGPPPSIWGEGSRSLSTMSIVVMVCLPGLRMLWMGKSNTLKTSSSVPVRRQDLRTCGWALISTGLKLMRWSKTPRPQVPGVDEILPGFLKALDMVQLSCFTQLCNLTWTSG